MGRLVGGLRGWIQPLSNVIGESVSLQPATPPTSAAWQRLPAWHQDGCHPAWREEVREAKHQAAGGRTQGIFRAVKILYDSVMVDTCHPTFVQTRGMCNPKSEP